ncbi:MAG: flagellar basal body L-ring protein FlgH [Candidatus Competibacteraceae bacterium]|nr:MAG: flagellar basal body L-ring protein FlgH [Candidatus Competibacteraceae bacterium]
MNRIVALIPLVLLAGCSGLVPHHEFTPVMPRVMVPEDPEIPVRRQSGAIYQANSDIRLFEDRTARRVGDIVVIRLVENTAASKSASTSVDKSSDVSLANPILFGAPFSARGATLDTDIAGERQHSGGGSSDQRNTLTGNVSAVVVGVYPNGNLAVRGEKMLTLNQGEEFVQISGIVRPEDIGANNTVLSSQVADAQITYAGGGVIADANTVGWLGRFFLSALWPF